MGHPLRSRASPRGAAAEDMSAPKRTVLVCVEGAIGVGKSTLLDQLSTMRKPGVVTLKEQVDEWKAVKIGSKNMLEAMYDGTISSALFQLSILQSRFGPLVRALVQADTRVVISERGPWSEKFVFAKSNLSETEFACYEYAHKSLIKDLFPIVGEVTVLFLHLELPFDAVVERIKTRGREEERQIQADYLTRLAAAHEAMKEELVTPASLGCPAALRAPRHVTLRADAPPAELAAAAWRLIEGVVVA